MLRYFGLGKLKEESSDGHCDDERMFVSIRTREEMAVKYVRCIRRVVKMATISFVVSETARYQAGRLV